METPAKKLKEGPDVSPQNENGTSTKQENVYCYSEEKKAALS